MIPVREPCVPAEISDHELMRQLASGQRDALALLVQRHQDKVRGLACRFLGRWDGAEDVCQDAFLRVYETAAQYQPNGQFTTWLYRVVANLCWDRRKRARREAQALPNGSWAGWATNDEMPVERRERLERICRAVAALPERQRLVLVLSRYGNLTRAEIVAVTGWSLPAVESCLVRAYRRLRELLSDEEDGCGGRD